MKLLLALVMLVICVLGVWGSGWGNKPHLEGHVLYQENPMLIAHRGAADKVPENTFVAARRAKELGFKSIEIDIKESSDQRFYLFHDRYGDRLFNRPDKISQQTLQEIQQWPLYHGGKPTKFYVPGFEEFTDRFQKDFIFYLDIKRHGNDRFEYLADKIFDYLKQYNLLDQALVGSDFLFTAYLEKRYPQIHTVFTGPGDGTIFVYKWIPKGFRPDFIISYSEEVTRRHIAWIRKHDLMSRRMIYGVNGANFQKSIDLGIPKLVVDYHPVMDAFLEPY